MHIRDILQPSRSTFSFEFFPANTTEGRDRLNDTITQLSGCQPDFVSITYGAGGSTRDATRQLVEHVRQSTPLNPVPHFTCVNHQRQDIDSILGHYAGLGISNILALRGDAPRGSTSYDHGKDFCVNGADLVRHIQTFNESGVHFDKRGFGIGVAGFPEGHPGTPNRVLEMDYLKAKIDAGADYICTQLFFDNHYFHDFRERCDLAGIRVPILAGILPVTSMAGLKRMAELSGGTNVPARLLKSLSRVQDDPAAVIEIGLHHATEQCSELLYHGVAGIHFYTLNQAAPTLEILKRLGRAPAKAAA
ncbi:methylenetetrahydrofolate reductase [NAD(P)H] [Brevifollis gellanilyticus]|uniref:Methylenetetrahydrofolate reductase n=1 Tax=Brevifollis gellanilyticus TaxID=748831 RepID=A0A512MDB4_9BACT|nr:methylenetetrahydrofolate reductase [NAD(P)H] [Brevifollis gellanilyticus]GEP44725.1 methylenetetrahydrofolate reductase [Brevifollis gellanilyticus]